MPAPFNHRAFVSLLIFLCLGVMLATSVLMFINPHTSFIASVHTGIGFILLSVLLWHLKNNFASLKSYFSLRPGKSRRLSLTLPAAALVGSVLFSLAFTHSPPFKTLYEWGNQLRANQATAAGSQFSYVRKEFIRADAKGDKLVIDLRKGAYFYYPQYALWLETLDGTFIQPLYVTQKLAQNNFANQVRQRNPQQVFNTDIANMDEQTWQQTFASQSLSNDVTRLRSRPESLPVFLHKLASTPATTVFTETTATVDTKKIDAYAGATLLDNFLLSTQAAQPLPAQFRVRLEINQSFDFNAYYSSDRFPEDPIYSGDGYNGQPSVIYEAIINRESAQRFYPMQLIGRGHHSGGDGIIHQDLQNITRAQHIVERIIVELAEGDATRP